MKRLDRKFLAKYKNTARKCAECGNPTILKTSKLKDGITYDYYSCEKCGQDFLDMKQLHNVAEKYRSQKRLSAKITRWGASLGVRIPKELVDKYKIDEKSEVQIIPEENGIKILL